MLKIQATVVAVLIVLAAFFVIRFGNTESPEVEKKNAQQRTTGYESRSVAGRPGLTFEPRTLLAAPPAIKEFPLESVAGADKTLKPDDLVLGVSTGEESRAYPINMLCGPQREIINDRLGGMYLAATW